MMEMSARDFELLILSLQLEEANAIKADIKKAQLSSFEILETFNSFLLKSMRLSRKTFFEKEEHSVLLNKFGVAGRSCKHCYLSLINECNNFSNGRF